MRVIGSECREQDVQYMKKRLRDKLPNRHKIPKCVGEIVNENYIFILQGIIISFGKQVYSHYFQYEMTE